MNLTKNDIRTGNILLYSLKSDPIRIPNTIGIVEDIGLFGDIGFNKDPHRNEEKIQLIHCAPIDLTPEILPFFGFELRHLERSDGSRYSWFWNGTTYAGFNETGNITFFGHNNLGTNHFIGRVPYIHDLQNLYYFCSFKKELACNDFYGMKIVIDKQRGINLKSFV